MGVRRLAGGVGVAVGGAACGVLVRVGVACGGRVVVRVGVGSAVGGVADGEGVAV